ncbi:p60 domain-containing protein [Apiospora phragmitis]|uniref:Ribosome biogenesis protein NOP53 n=1 Tax=Apiospora phragmitis TaxID=2905665 RepID=A0ABR1T9B7_9PEZI
MPVLKAPTGSADAPATYKQPSRKGKKAWRKNVDVTEVQDGLEELNEAIIKGGLVNEKPSEELFTLDTVGDASIPKRFPRHTSKPLKSEEILTARSVVPAVDSRKRPSSKTTDGLVPAKRLRTNYVTHKELTRLRKVADGHHELTLEVTEDAYDPWATPAPAEKQLLLQQIEEPMAVPDVRIEKKKAPKTITQAPISLAASGKRVPAVVKPTGAFSYNPSFPEYEARLAEESEKALAAEKKRLAEEEADRLKKEAAARSAAEAEAAEARAQLSEWEEDSEWDGFQSGGEQLAASKKRPERKNQQQRNRIKRRKEEERRLKHEAKTKVRKAQLEEIKKLAQEARERDQSMALIQAQAGQGESDSGMEQTDDVVRRRQLGKYKVPEKDLELVLPDELEESLRRLKPEGNPLKDRYRSLILRGKLEARRKIPFKKQARMKATEKWSYKDFQI